MKRFLMPLLFLLFLASSALAAVEPGKELAGDGAGGRVEIEATTTYDAVVLPVNAQHFVLELDADAVSGTDPTLDVDVEYSLDGGTNWYVLESFSQVTSTDDTETIHIDSNATHVPARVRAKATLGGTDPVYNIKVWIYFERK